MQADSGGQGVCQEESPEPQHILADPHHLRADAQIIRRAVVHGWGVGDKSKALVIQRMTAILDEGSGCDVRQMTAAARVLVAADAIDQRTEAIDRIGRTEFIRPDPIQPAPTVNVTVNNTATAQAAAIAGEQPAAVSACGGDIWAEIDGIKAELAQAAHAEELDGEAPAVEDEATERRRLAGLSADSHAKSPEAIEPEGVMSEGGWSMPDVEETDVEPETPAPIPDPDLRPLPGNAYQAPPSPPPAPPKPPDERIPYSSLLDRHGKPKDGRGGQAGEKRVWRGD